MTNPRLVKPVFTFNTTDEAIAVKDAYSVTSGAAINSFQDIKQTVITDLFPELSAQIKKAAALNIPLTATGIIDSITKAIPNLKNDLKSLSSTALGAFKEAAALKGQVTAIVNGAETFIKNGDISSIAGVAGIVNSITNQATLAVSQITDNKILSGVISGVTAQASTMGINGVFTQIAASGINSSAILTAGLSLLSNAKTDINLLKDLSTSNISKQLGSVNPNLAKTVMNGLSSAGKSAKTLMSDYNTITSALGSFDVNWDKSKVRSDAFDSSIFQSKDSSSDISAYIGASSCSVVKTINPTIISLEDLPVYDDPVFFQSAMCTIEEVDAETMMAGDYPEAMFA